jgi:formylglycine-generating enzyme required for sulfatase activity
MTGASTEASAGASTEASSGASTAATTGASSEAAPVPPDPLAWAAGIALPAGVRPTETPGEFVNEADGSVLVRVPAGPALIGSAPGEGIEADETPAHEVRLEEYFMGKTEVTNAQYARFLAWLRARPSGDRDISHPLQPFDKSHVPDSDASIAWTASGKAPEGIEDLPVVLIDWYDAYAYCHWAGGTLPSEAQWERAAGQGEPGAARRRFPWGDVYEKGRAHVADVVSGRDFASAEEWAAWHDRIASGTAASWPAGRISKVGAYPEGASPLGLLDVSGNAREWCLDFYDAEFYARSPERNPVNLRPTKEGMRVNRGGCWINYPPNARVSYRDYAAPSFRSEEIGFRLCIPGKSR